MSAQADSGSSNSKSSTPDSKSSSSITKRQPLDPYVRGPSSPNSSQSSNHSARSRLTTPSSASDRYEAEILAQAPETPCSFPHDETPRGTDHNSLASERSTVKLQEIYGTWDTINLFLGIIIGSGIFISAKMVSQACPNAGMAIVCWLFCGLYSLLGSLCFAELGTCFPESGGDFAYLRRLLGPCGDFVAFIRIWVEMLMLRPASQAAIAVTTAKYLIVPFLTGNLEHMWMVGEEDMNETQAITYGSFRLTVHAYEVLVSIAVTTLFTLINCWSVYLTQMISGLLSVLKVLVLAFMMVLGVVLICQARQLCPVGIDGPNCTDCELVYQQCNGSDANSVSYLSPKILFNFSSWAGYSWVNWISRLSIACYAAMWGYAGWSDISYAMEEIVNPSKNLPIAAGFSLTLVTLLYTMIIVGYYAVMQQWEVTAFNEATATLYILKAFKIATGESLAAHAVFNTSSVPIEVEDFSEDLFAVRLVTTLTAVAVALAASGSLHGSLFASARLLFVGARWGHLPEALGGVHRDYKTPIPSLILLGVLTNFYCFAAFSDSAIEFFINATCFVYFGSIILCVAALIVWRLQGRPNVGSVLDNDQVSLDERKPLISLDPNMTITEEIDANSHDDEEDEEELIYVQRPIDDTRALLRATLDGDKIEKFYGFSTSCGVASSITYRSRRISKGFLPNISDKGTRSDDDSMIRLSEPYIISLFWHFLFVIIGVVMVGFSIIDQPVQCGTGIVLIIIGIPVYFMCVRNRPPAPKWWKLTTAWIFKTMNCQLEEISGTAGNVQRSPRRLLSMSDIFADSMRSASGPSYTTDLQPCP